MEKFTCQVFTNFTDKVSFDSVSKICQLLEMSLFLEESKRTHIFYVLKPLSLKA